MSEDTTDLADILHVGDIITGTNGEAITCSLLTPTLYVKICEIDNYPLEATKKKLKVRPLVESEMQQEKFWMITIAKNRSGSPPAGKTGPPPVAPDVDQCIEIISVGPYGAVGIVVDIK